MSRSLVPAIAGAVVVLGACGSVDSSSSGTDQPATVSPDPEARAEDTTPAEPRQTESTVVPTSEVSTTSVESTITSSTTSEQAVEHVAIEERVFDLPTHLVTYPVPVDARPDPRVSRNLADDNPLVEAADRWVLGEGNCCVYALVVQNVKPLEGKEYFLDTVTVGGYRWMIYRGERAEKNATATTTDGDVSFALLVDPLDWDGDQQESVDLAIEYVEQIRIERADGTTPTDDPPRPEEDTGGLDGPVVFTRHPTSGETIDLPKRKDGVLAFDGECLFTTVADRQYAYIWFWDTRWDDQAQRVEYGAWRWGIGDEILPDHRVLDDLGDLVTDPAAKAHAELCGERYGGYLLV